MKQIVTGEQMRRADQFMIETVGLPSLVLMERAALGVVEQMEAASLDMSHILIVCGTGNNGGDGYAIARLLHLKGYRVTMYQVGSHQACSEENRLQQSIAMKYEIPMTDTLEDRYSVIVDAIFGTGLRRDIVGAYAEVLDALNGTKAYKVAVDIPSGVHDTTGQVMGIGFRADLTVCIAYQKLGVALYPGSAYAGKVVVADIGITPDAIPQDTRAIYCYEWLDLQKNFPKRAENAHKGNCGKVLMIVGGRQMAGAAFLSAKAAYAVGAGLVQIYTPEDNRTILQQLLPEAIVTTYDEFEEEQLQGLLDWADVTAIGCGLGCDETAVRLVAYTLRHAEGICVVDADGLNMLAKNREWMLESKASLILTPHMKEMSRLLHCTLEQVCEERIPRLEEFVTAYPVCCVLKDARTMVMQGSDAMYLNLSGNASMAKGGSGDVLTGIIAGIAGQRCATMQAATLGVYLHGLAGESASRRKGLYSVLASDMIDSIGEILKEL